MALAHTLPPSVMIDIPWEALDSNRKMYIRAVCNPTNITTLTPEKMSVAEINYLYRHIHLLQNTEDRFSFMSIYHAVGEGPVLDPSMFFPYSISYPPQNISCLGPASSALGGISKNTCL